VEHLTVDYFMGMATTLLINVKSLKKIANDKRSSLSAASVSDEEKNVYDIDTWSSG